MDNLLSQAEPDIPAVLERGMPVLLERFNQMWKEIDRTYHEMARRSGLSDCAFWIMYGVAEADGSIRQTSMSKDWQYSRQTVASAVRQLEGRELITVSLDEGSQRDKRITLTEAGERFVVRYVNPAMMAEQEALEQLGVKDAETLFALMRRYTRLLDRSMNSRMPDDDE